MLKKVNLKSSADSVMALSIFKSRTLNNHMQNVLRRKQDIGF
jgi:hypothetical protein